MINDEFSDFAIGQMDEEEEEVGGDNPGDAEELVGIDEDEPTEDDDEDEEDEEIAPIEEDE